MAIIRRSAYAALAAPLALALAACSAAEDSETALDSEPIAEIAAPEGAQWVDTVSISDYDGYVLGNPDAPIKVIEYASLTCPACAAFAKDGASELKEEYVNSGRVSFELRNQIHGPHDLLLARLVRCGAPEGFHPLSEQVWANLNEILSPLFNDQATQAAFEQALQLPEDQRFVAAAEAAGFYDFFAARGVSEDQARTCLADFASMETIANNSNSQGQEFDVTGTPTFFVNGQKLDGVLNWAGLEPVLQRAGAR